jgi:hypothetical protein
MEARVTDIEDSGSRMSREEVEAVVGEAVGRAVVDASMRDVVLRERERSDAEMARMQQGAREVLDQERRTMSECVCSPTEQVCEWVVRQQQEQLLKQVAVLQEEAERFGGGCPYSLSCGGSSSPPNWY